MTFTTTITREIEVTVAYAFHKGSKGARDSINGVRGAGPPLEPDEPDSVDLLAVVDKSSGRDIDLTPAEESELEEQALKDHQDAADAAAEDRADEIRPNQPVQQ